MDLKYLIPEWEKIAKEIAEKKEELVVVVDDICLFLRLEEARLRDKAKENVKANKEWEEVKEQLKNCDSSIEGLIGLETIVLQLRRSGIPRDPCIPENEFSCKVEFTPGDLLMNFKKIEGKTPEIYIISAKGEILSKGKVVGNDTEFEDVVQLSISLNNLENGSMEVRNGNTIYNQRIAIH